MSVDAVSHVWSAAGVTAEEKLVLLWIANNSGGLGYSVCPEWIGMGEFACVGYERACSLVYDLADKGLVRLGTEDDNTAHVIWLVYDGPYFDPVDFTAESKSRSKRVAALIERDGAECVYCGATPLQYHVDHFIPRAKGGVDRMDNLVLACAPCNQAKSDKDPAVFLAGTPDRYTKLVLCLQASAE